MLGVGLMIGEGRGYMTISPQVPVQLRKNGLDLIPIKSKEFDDIETPL